MPNESSFPYTPRPQNDTLQRAEVRALHLLIPSAHSGILTYRFQVYPQTGTHGNIPWQNGHQPGVNYPSPYHGRNDANYGDGAQHRYDVWNDGPPPPSESAVGCHLFLYPTCSPC